MNELQVDPNAVIEHLSVQVSQQAKQIAILQALLQQSQQAPESGELEQEVTQ